MAFRFTTEDGCGGQIEPVVTGAEASGGHGRDVVVADAANGTCNCQMVGVCSVQYSSSLPAMRRSSVTVPDQDWSSAESISQINLPALEHSQHKGVD